MNRRSFLTTALAATAGGLLVPEWILDPPKGRSMVAVPEMPKITPWLSLEVPPGEYSVHYQLRFAGEERWRRVRECVRVSDGESEIKLEYPQGTQITVPQVFESVLSKYDQDVSLGFGYLEAP